MRDTTVQMLDKYACIFKYEICFFVRLFETLLIWDIYNLLVKRKLAPVVCLFILSIWTLLTLVRWAHWHFFSYRQNLFNFDASFTLQTSASVFTVSENSSSSGILGQIEHRVLPPTGHLIISVSMEPPFCRTLSVLLFCTSPWLSYLSSYWYKPVVLQQSIGVCFKRK